MKSLRGDKMHQAYLKDEYHYKLRHGMKPEKLETESKRSLKVSGNMGKKVIFGTGKKNQEDTLLKGFTVNKRVFTREEAPLLTEVKKQKKHFEFITSVVPSKSLNPNNLLASGTVSNILTDNDSRLNGTPQIKRVQKTALKASSCSLPALRKKKVSANEREDVKYLLQEIGQKDPYNEEEDYDPDSETIEERHQKLLAKETSHPIKDGLKLLMLGEGLLKQEEAFDNVQPYERLVVEENSNHRRINYYIPKLSNAGRLV